MEELSLSSKLLHELPHPVLTVGSFDGLHLAHQAILQEVAGRARAAEGSGLVLTFEPHPKTVLNPDSPQPLLTPRDEKLEILRSMALDFLVVLPFTPELSRISAKEFVESILLGMLGTREVVIGHDHGFGRERRGSLKMLRDLAACHEFEVVAIDPILFSGKPISSTRIRRCLLEGRVQEAAKMLGRPYDLSGRVVTGQKRGRDLKYPTANLEVASDKLIPADGVYAVLSAGDRGGLQGMINIGQRPTFGKGNRTLEIHFFDFEGSLYDQSIHVQLIEKIRDEQRFTDARELMEQMQEDEQVARRLLALKRVRL